MTPGRGHLADSIARVSMKPSAPSGSPRTLVGRSEPDGWIPCGNLGEATRYSPAISPKEAFGEMAHRPAFSRSRPGENGETSTLGSSPRARAEMISPVIGARSTPFR